MPSTSYEAEEVYELQKQRTEILREKKAVDAKFDEQVDELNEKIRTFSRRIYTAHQETFDNKKDVIYRSIDSYDLVLKYDHQSKMVFPRKYYYTPGKQHVYDRPVKHTEEKTESFPFIPKFARTK